MLVKPLDRERQSFLHLILTAKDGGDPPLSGTTQIRIQVTDASDNAPFFSQTHTELACKKMCPGEPLCYG